MLNRLEAFLVANSSLGLPEPQPQPWYIQPCWQVLKNAFGLSKAFMFAKAQALGSQWFVSLPQWPCQDVPSWPNFDMLSSPTKVKQGADTIFALESQTKRKVESLSLPPLRWQMDRSVQVCSTSLAPAGGHP